MSDQRVVVPQPYVVVITRPDGGPQWVLLFDDQQEAKAFAEKMRGEGTLRKYVVLPLERAVETWKEEEKDWGTSEHETSKTIAELETEVRIRQEKVQHLHDEIDVLHTLAGASAAVWADWKDHADGRVRRSVAVALGAALADLYGEL